MKVLGHLLLLSWTLASQPQLAEAQCNICGDGNEIGDPDELYEFNGVTQTCQEHQDMDYETGDCLNIQTFIARDDACDCRPEGGWPLCFICGVSTPVVGRPDDPLQYEGEQLTCGEVQEIGTNGGINPNDCVMTQTEVANQDVCGCQPTGGWPVCNVCGDTTPVITAPNDTVTFRNEELTCGELQELGDEGAINDNDCVIVKNDIANDGVCGCQPEEGGQPSPKPTPSPVAMPTPTEPTESPTTSDDAARHLVSSTSIYSSMVSGLLVIVIRFFVI